LSPEGNFFRFFGGWTGEAATAGAPHGTPPRAANPATGGAGAGAPPR